MIYLTPLGCTNNSEHVLQEHQYQLHQVQQQVQMQQTQLLQQQTEIVGLRAAVEVEQKQGVLLQQRLQEEQRLNGLQFNRRVSGDGDLNGSFLMIETSNSGGVSPGLVPMNMSFTDATTSAMGGTSMGVMSTGGAGRGTQQAFSSSGPSPMSPMSNMMAQGLHSHRQFEGSSPSVLSQLSMTPVQTATSQAQTAGTGAAAAAALPPIGIPSMVPTGGMSSAGTTDVEPKPRMIHHGSSSSISSIKTVNTSSNRLSAHGDSMPSPAVANQV